MNIPAQGFRHAATLLMTNSARAIPSDASPQTVRAALARLAHELVSLADDMRVPAGTAAWLTAELNATIDRLPQAFDRDEAKGPAAAVLERVGSGASRGERRDLFLIHVSEDRLPVAGPLAVELTKQRVSVAFAEYEVDTAEQFTAAVAHGLANHRGGLILKTRAFDRREWLPVEPTDQIRIISDTGTCSDLVNWASRLRLSSF